MRLVGIFHELWCHNDNPKTAGNSLIIQGWPLTSGLLSNKISYPQFGVARATCRGGSVTQSRGFFTILDKSHRLGSLHKIKY